MTEAYYHYKTGKNLSKKKNFLKAIMHFEKAKAIEPEKGSIRESLARAYYNCGFYVSAKKNFKKAIEIDATNDFAHYGLSMALIKIGRIKKAKGHIRIALSMKPKSEKYKKLAKKFGIKFQ